MKQLNKLYACLVYGTDIKDTHYYKKLFTPVIVTQRTTQLLSVLRHKVKASDYPKYACVLLYTLMQTTLASDIESLDAQNTYKQLVVDNLFPFYSMLPTKYELKKQAYKLDQDLQQKLKEKVDLYDQIAVYCIQMLRDL